jgi:deoxycytidylate deaminase
MDILVNKVKDIAGKSECKKYMHGAILFNSKNKIISVGCNQYGGTRILGNNVPTLHAEIHCLKHIFIKNKWSFKNIQKSKFKRRVKRKINIIVVRVTMSGELASSMPCHMCLKMMQNIGINKVYYSTDSGKIISQKINTFCGHHITKAFKQYNPIKRKYN